MINFSKHAVLIVDDEIEILKALKRGLHLEPYKKYFASSGAEALEIIAREDEISVIITDMRMPGMTGLDLLKKVDDVSPNMIKIVLTGYTQLPQILATVNKLDIFKFMTKPWDLDAELKVYIKEAIELYEIATTNQNKLATNEKKSVLFNKLINDSYEKVDHLLKLYEELLKVFNQHHLITMQSLRGIESPEVLATVVMQTNQRVHYINRLFELSRSSMKTFTLADFEEVLIKRSPEMPLKIVDSDTVFFDNFKMLSSIMDDIVLTFLEHDSKLEMVGLSSEMEEAKEMVQFLIIGSTSMALENAFEEHNKIIMVVVKLLGGSYNYVRVDHSVRIKMLIPVKEKSITE